MTDGLRDLASEDVWLHSLERSRARRGLTPVGTAGVPVRDLTNPEFWTTSVDRSRRKREWRERQLRFGPLDTKRVAVPAALLAGGLAVTEVVGGAGSGGNAATAGTLPQDPIASNAASKHVIKQHASKKRAAPKATAKTQPIAAKPKKKPQVVINTLSEAQSLGGFKKGMHGPAVATMQKQLGINADGIYGPQTLKAVHAFQKKHGLTTDGIVGPVTMHAIKNPSAVKAKTHSAVQHSGVTPGKTGNVRTASAKILVRGSEVEQLQQRLGLAVDGDYGAKTEAAVKRWQRRHGLTDDGVVGPATWQALGLSSSNRTLHPHRFGETKHATHHSSQQSSSSGSSSSGSSNGGGGSASGSSVVARAIAAANAIATKPYRYGGGHGSFQDSGYDCSGSVSDVLHGAGLLSAPLDSTGLESYGEPGPGKYITIYANAGHAWMTINGRRFDTGYGGEGNRWASGSRPTAGFVVRHPPGL
jgi:peptidoglycan hydrolase-like protein with peptidoglycan-binding domain